VKMDQSGSSIPAEWVDGSIMVRPVVEPRPSILGTPK
jgi:hypothetical protein